MVIVDKAWLGVTVIWMIIGVVIFLWSGGVTKEDNRTEYLRRSYLSSQYGGAWAIVGMLIPAGYLGMRVLLT